MIILTLAGVKGSGKDFFAKILKEQLEKKFSNKKIQIAHFADPFKDCLYGIFKYLDVKKEWIFGSDAEKLNIIPGLYNPLYPDLPLSVRNMLQWFGTEVFRKLDEDIWIKIAVAKLLEDKPDVAIIADLRFDNELDIDEVYKAKTGSYPIVLNIKIKAQTSSTDSHPSEAVDKIPITRFDFVVENDKVSTKPLLQAAEEIISMLENEKGELDEHESVSGSSN